MKQIFFLMFFSALFLSGCCLPREYGTAEIKAVYTPKAPVLDGKLSEEAWLKAPAYHLEFSQKRKEDFHPSLRDFYKNGPVDKGFFKLLWNEKYLYIAACFKDQDLVAEGTADQQSHCRFGDLLEIFLKPENDPRYRELYVTPKNHRTVFFYHGRGRHGLPSTLPAEMPLKKYRSAVRLTGTLNQPDDKDIMWCIETAIPLDELAGKNVKLAPGIPWRILLARYNFTKYAPQQELTTSPAMSKTDFHLHEEYGRLRLVR